MKKFVLACGFASLLLVGCDRHRRPTRRRRKKLRRKWKMRPRSLERSQTK